MNPRRLFASLLATALAPVALLGVPEPEPLQLQSMLYVFKNSDFRSVGVEAVSAAEAGRSQVFRSPATVRFDEHSLMLRGENFVWSTGELAPASIGLIAAPTIRADYGQTATLRCVARAQYVERRADGRFDLREIAPDSPDVPRYLLSFVVEPGRRAEDELRITCIPEFAAIRDREKIPGVDLDVGRPRMSFFKDELKLTLPRNEWVALLFRTPEENDYSVLALFRVVAGAAAGAQPTDETAASSGTDAMQVLVAAQRTEGGRNAPAPSAASPVSYIAYDGGHFEAGPSLAGAKLPSAGEISAAFHSSLAAQAYVPATVQNPPTIVLIYHWGYDRGDRTEGTDRVARRAGKQFVYVSAYDYRALQQRKAVLLWHALLKAKNDGAYTEILPALVSACGPYLGLDLEVPRPAALSPARGPLQSAATGSPLPIPSEITATLPAEFIRTIVKQEHQFLADGRMTKEYLGRALGVGYRYEWMLELPSIPARTKDKPRAEREVPMLKLQASARIAPGGISAPQSTLEHPVPVLAYDGGLFETGDLVAGTKYPSSADMSAAFSTAFSAAGYVSATAQRPPAAVLVYHWGYDRKQRDAIGPDRKALSVPVLLRSTIYVSAYDFTALQRREKTLLWRVALVTEDAVRFTQLFPVLARACAPYLGRSVEGIQEDTAPLAPARSATGEPSFAASPEIAATLDQDVIRTLVEQEHRFLNGGGRLHVDEKPGTSLVPVGQ